MGHGIRDVGGGLVVPVGVEVFVEVFVALGGIGGRPHVGCLVAGDRHRVLTRVGLAQRGARGLTTHLVGRLGVTQVDHHGLSTGLGVEDGNSGSGGSGDPHVDSIGPVHPVGRHQVEVVGGEPGPVGHRGAGHARDGHRTAHTGHRCVHGGVEVGGHLAGRGQGTGQGQRLGAGQGLGRPQEPGRERAGVDALLGIGVSGAGEHVDQRAQGLRHLELAVDPRHERAQGGVGRERHHTGDGLDEHDGQRVHVGLAREGLALGLLGRRVPCRTEHCALRLGPGRLGQGPGQTEVGDAQALVVAEQQVGGLDVAVDETPAVGVVQRPGGVEAHGERLGRGQQVAGVEQGPQAPTREVLGDDERHLVVSPVVDGHHVGVVEGGRGPGLGREPPQELGIAGQGVVEHLHRHATTEADVVGQEDLGGGAHADRCDQPVAPSQHPADLCRHARIGHRSRVPPGRARFGEPPVTAPRPAGTDPPA